jgi:PAS domain S-box-containing protein
VIEAEVRLLLSNCLPVLSITESIQDLLGFASRDYVEGTISLRDQIHQQDRGIADVLFAPEIHPESGIFNIRLRQANSRIRCIKASYIKEVGRQGIELKLLLQDAKSLNRTMPDTHLGTSLSAMLESTDDYIYFKDRNHVFTGASQTLVSITESAKWWSDLLGQTDYDVFPEELADVYYALEKQVFAGIPVAREVQQYISKDGRRGWVDNRKYPIRDANDEIIGLYGIARDITELREAEARVLRLNRAHRLLSECSMALVRFESEEQLIEDICQLVVNTGGYLLAWVGFAYQDVEKSVHPASQYGFEDGYLESIQISWSEDTEIGRGPTGTAIRTGITQVNQNVWTNPNMVPWREQAIRRGYRSSIALPLSNAGTIIGALSVYSADPDSFGVDESVLLEELAANLTFGILTLRTHAEKAAAETASRAKSAFLANMSHEIRTPMNSILGMTSIMRREGVTPKQRERLDTISTSAQHLLSVINDILDISKIEAGKLILEEIQFNVSDLLGNVRSILSESAGAKKIQLLIENATLPSNLLGDPMRLQQAVLNYASNALKFTQTGSVVMRTTKLDEAANWVLVRFEVQDSGIGIPPEAMSRLFGAFEQADNSTTRKYGGTGLGLAITRRLAELMGGAAGAESTPGVGSKFWFTARLTKGGDAEVRQAVPSVDAEKILRQRYSGARILVVDDEPINREVAQMLLEDIGLVVDQAADGGEAVSIARERGYAAVFMDMQMPQVNGLEATRLLREIPDYRHTPIIALTANAFAEDKARCFEAGMSDFLIKPFDPDTLFATLLRALSREEE